MALDFSVLQNINPAGAFFQGQQAVRQEAEQNQLRQMQRMQFEQAQQDRAFQMQQRQIQAERDAKFDQIAGLISQHGMDPDDPKVLGQFAQAAMQARNPAMVEFAGQMAERAAKRRAAKEEAARISGILSPALPPGPPLRQPVEPGTNALAAPPTNALAAPQQDLLAGTPFAIGPMAAPAAPARPAAPAVQDNTAKIAEFERQRDALEAIGTPAALAQAKRLDRLLERLQPKQEATPADIVAMRRLGFPETPEGYRAYRDAQRAERLLTPEEEAQRVRIALASRPPAQPREPNKPVEVVGPDGKTIIVSAEEAIANRMTPAKAIEGLTPKERQSREAKFPQATAAVKTFESTTDTLVKDLQRLANHPGLGSITGIAAGRLPGVTPAGREAEALFDKIVARGGFQELMNMRNQSPTGGALGNVSNEEGRRLQAAFAALDRRQDAGSVRKAVADAIEQLQGAKARVRDAYDLTYEYKQGGGAMPTPAPAPASNIDALLNKYK